MNSFHSNYKIGQMIGSGFSSYVYECLHLFTNTKYACKLVTRNIFKKNMNDENIPQQCNHPNINKIYEVYYQNYENRSVKYIISELGKGDLFTYLENNNSKLSENEAKHIIKQMTMSINYLHDNNICHRDIKLQNFIYNQNTEIKLIDFEFAQDMNKEPIMLGRKGTLSYIAPEMFSNNKYCNKIDIWSLGVSSYMLLTNQNPIIKDYYKTDKLNFDIDFNIKELDNVTSECKDFLKNLLQKKPEKRLSSNEALNHNWLVY